MGFVGRKKMMTGRGLRRTEAHGAIMTTLLNYIWKINQSSRNSKIRERRSLEIGKKIDQDEIRWGRKSGH